MGLANLGVRPTRAESSPGFNIPRDFIFTFSVPLPPSTATPKVVHFGHTPILEHTFDFSVDKTAIRGRPGDPTDILFRRGKTVPYKNGKRIRIKLPYPKPATELVGSSSMAYKDHVDQVGLGSVQFDMQGGEQGLRGSADQPDGNRATTPTASLPTNSWSLPEDESKLETAADVSLPCPGQESPCADVSRELGLLCLSNETVKYHESRNNPWTVGLSLALKPALGQIQVAM